MKFHIFFTDDVELVYDIVEEQITKKWANAINELDINELCKHNHYVGYTPESVVNEKVKRLYEINDLANQRLPNLSVNDSLTKENWNEVLHRMHVNFVELVSDEKHSDIWQDLTEYNDIIHWLESMLVTWWDEELRNQQAKLFRITLDFNKSRKKIFQPVPESAYKLFYPFSEFGNIYLHYTHIGKNPYGIFLDRDYTIPKDQLVIQHTFTASVRLVFSDNFLGGQSDKLKFLNNWKRFYQDRGGKDFWGYDFEDPRLGFGFMKIGELTELKIKNKNIDIPTSFDERHEFRKMLAGTKVLRWKAE